MPRKKVTPREYAELSAGVRLSSHEKLCAERMKLLHESITELKKEVKSLRGLWSNKSIWDGAPDWKR